jgi:SNF2 family DNA or RNA helicase
MEPEMTRLLHPNNPPPLRLHQTEALEFSRKKRHPEFFGLFMDPGTGKTKIAFEKMAEEYLNRTIDTALVFAPNGVHVQWLEEQAVEHCPIPYRQILWAGSRGKTWKEQSLYTLKKKDALLIVAMNYEALTTKNGLHFCRYLLKNRKVAIFADESSRIRNPRAIRTKQILGLAEDAPVRVIMTGTPIAKGMENLWSQMQFLSPDILHCKSFVQFRSLYCKVRPVPGRRGAVMISGYQRVEELLSLIAPHVFIKTKEDCLDLPDKIYQKSPVPLTKEQEVAYQTMRDELIVQLSELERVTVAHLISARAKLRQIAIGFILDQQRRATPLVSARWTRALEHLEEAPGKTILWTSFRWCLAEWERVLQKNGIGYVRYQKGDNESIRQWRRDSGIKVFLGNPHSGGIGLNLAAADTMIYFNNTDDAEVRWQSEDRAHRIGQTQHLNIIDLFSPETVEVKMQRQQADKETLADIVMRRGWRAAL